MRISYDLNTGEVTEHPDEPSSMTPAEMRAIELAALNAALQANFDALTMQYAKALLADGTSEATKVAAIRTQQTTLKSQYSADVAAVIAKYNSLQPV